MREAIVNTIGGRMSKYEALLDQTIARALETLAERARAKGYDGVLDVRIAHPTITTGAIAVTVTGTGFRSRGGADLVEAMPRQSTTARASSPAAAPDGRGECAHGHVARAEDDPSRPMSHLDGPRVEPGTPTALVVLLQDGQRRMT